MYVYILYCALLSRDMYVHTYVLYTTKCTIIAGHLGHLGLSWGRREGRGRVDILGGEGGREGDGWAGG